MSFSFKGYGENVLTFPTKLTEAGIPVEVGANSVVSKAAADKDFIGVTSYADGELAGVILNGYVELPYTGTAPAFGFSALAANGTGGVKTASSATHLVKVIKVDTSKKTVGFIL